MDYGEFSLCFPSFYFIEIRTHSDTRLSVNQSSTGLHHPGSHPVAGLHRVSASWPFVAIKFVPEMEKRMKHHCCRSLVLMIRIHLRSLLFRKHVDRYHEMEIVGEMIGERMGDTPRIESRSTSNG